MRDEESKNETRSGYRLSDVAVVCYAFLLFRRALVFNFLNLLVERVFAIRIQLKVLREIGIGLGVLALLQ